MSPAPTNRLTPGRAPAHRRTPGPRLTAIGVGLASALVALGAAVATGPVTDDASTPLQQVAEQTSYSIWSDSVVPKVPSDPERNGVTLGVKFSSGVEGTVTAIRFYKSTRNVGPHTGQLWTASGRLLATTTFDSTSTAGWQEAKLSTPVTISPDTAYVASYTAPKGRYAADIRSLSPRHPTVTQDLTAVRGVYTYGRTVPNQTYKNSNYYVDVRFDPGAPAAAAASTSTSPPTATISSTATSSPPATSSSTSSTSSTATSSAPATSSSTSSTSSTATSSAPATSSSTSSTATSSPTPTSSSTSSTSTPSSGGFPNDTNTGVPAGWSPTATRSSNLVVSTAGSTVQDIRIVNANLVIDAQNVTVRRVEIQGGRVEIRAKSGTVLDQVSVIKAPGQVTDSGGTEAIGPGGYTARRVKIDGLPEGFRVGGKSSGFGPVTIEDSFVRVVAPDQCGDWHGDGLQGYDGPAVTVRNLTIDFQERSGCGGTAPFFYPANQGNTSADIDGLLVKGGGYSFRDGMPGTVRNLKIVNNAWGYGPIEVRCSVVTGWDAEIVTIDSAYQPTAVRQQACNT